MGQSCGQHAVEIATRELPDLFGHCVLGGKTGLTITTPTQGIWQVGGEIAERMGEAPDNAASRRIALREIRRWLPDLELKSLEIALYHAVRAEARTDALRRPSGVHASQVARGVVIGWPTKLSMVPVLADEILQLVQGELKEPSGDNETPPWPSPDIARYPWEDAQWFAAR